MTTPRRGSACAPPLEGHFAEGGYSYRRLRHLLAARASSGYCSLWRAAANCGVSQPRICATGLTAIVPIETMPYVLPYATPAANVGGGFFCVFTSTVFSSQTTPRIYPTYIQYGRRSPKGPETANGKHPVRISQIAARGIA